MVDTHCHLYMEPLFGDAEGVLSRAVETGVTMVVVPAFDTASWSQVRELCRTTGVFPALGLHPWKAAEGLDLKTLRQELEDTGAVAVGEIGLDSKVDPPALELQSRVLTDQLDLALEMDLPVILHCRGCFDEMISILSKERYRGRLRGVMHAYSRSPQLARRLLDLGLYLAFGGAVTRPRAERARRSAATVPMDRILLETDAPSIGMEGINPESVEPAHVLRVAESVAHLRGITPEETARMTTRNAKRLFGLHAG